MPSQASLVPVVNTVIAKQKRITLVYWEKTWTHGLLTWSCINPESLPVDLNFYPSTFHSSVPCVPCMCKFQAYHAFNTFQASSTLKKNLYIPSIPLCGTQPNQKFQTFLKFPSIPLLSLCEYSFAFFKSTLFGCSVSLSWQILTVLAMTCILAFMTQTHKMYTHGRMEPSYLTPTIKVENQIV